MRIKLVYLFMFGILCILNAPAFAAIAGPYTADANTLHLYHLDEADGVSTCADVVGTQNMNGVAGVVSVSPPAGVFNNVGVSLLGNTSYTTTPGFGTAANFSANALSIVAVGGTTNPCNPAPHRPILLGGTQLSNNDSTDLVPFSFSSTPGTGAAGAFTMEAVVKLSFDPTLTNYRNTAATTTAPGNPGAYPMDILMGESDSSNGYRNFQFRIDQIGFGSAANVKNPDGSSQSGTTQVRIEFANLYGIVGNQSLICNIPTTGPNAINNTDWFHIAVSYNGLEGTDGNLSFYWTKMDPNNTQDSLIGLGHMNKDLLAASTEFSIGNEARDTGTGTGEGESFVGSIDEVRISSVARGADQMMFTVPEPATCLMALIGIFGMGLIWLRKSR
jgi:hypothetical protein